MASSEPDFIKILLAHEIWHPSLELRHLATFRGKTVIMGGEDARVKSTKIRRNKLRTQRLGYPPEEAL